MLNLNLTYQNGIRVDVDDSSNLGPFLSYTDALDAIRDILEEAASNLSAAGNTFPFD